MSVVREELLSHPDILSVSSCSHLPSNIQSWIGYLDWEGRSPERRVYPAFISVDYDFIWTAGMTVIKGRDFSRSRPVDAENFIINETALRQIGIEDPIGLELRFWGHKGQVVGIANAVAWPTAYVVMQRWLQDYAYRTAIGIWVFVLAGGLGLFIALLSVGYQTLRAATANPVDSLRNE